METSLRLGQEVVTANLCRMDAASVITADAAGQPILSDLERIFAIKKRQQWRLFSVEMMLSPHSRLALARI